MTKVKLLALKNRNLPESVDNQLEEKLVDIDQRQVTCSIWGNNFSTIHTCAIVDGELKLIRAVVRHESARPHVIDPKELERVHWSLSEDLGDLVTYKTQETIGEL